MRLRAAPGGVGAAGVHSGGGASVWAALGPGGAGAPGESGGSAPAGDGVEETAPEVPGLVQSGDNITKIHWQEEHICDLPASVFTAFTKRDTAPESAEHCSGFRYCLRQSAAEAAPQSNPRWKSPWAAAAAESSRPVRQGVPAAAGMGWRRPVGERAVECFGELPVRKSCGGCKCRLPGECSGYTVPSPPQ